jgi:hypothetical protein
MFRMRKLTSHTFASALLCMTALALLRGQSSAAQEPLTPPATISVSRTLAQENLFLGSVPTGESTEDDRSGRS